jgi:hypothetical protein
VTVKLATQLTFLALALLPACASLPGGLDHPPGFEAAPGFAAGERLWSRQLEGVITDLSVAADGSALSVATAPDPDAAGLKKFRLARLDRDGEAAWSRDLESPVRAQTISADGKLVLAATYDGKLTAYGPAGAERWSVEAPCRPLLLEKTSRVVCYHDDDAEPGVAFDVFDLSGAKLSSLPIDADVLTLKVSSDQARVVVGLAGGRVILAGTDSRVEWNASVPGEIVDVAVTGAGEARVAVLYSPGKVSSEQRLVLLGPDGKKLAEGPAPHHSEAVDFRGDAVAAYGNGSSGQWLTLLGASGKTLSTEWSRGDALIADFSSPLIVSGETVVIGFEDVVAGTRHSHVVAFDSRGGMLWNIPLPARDGTYLYGEAFAPHSPGGALVAVGTDEGVLSAYRVR